MAKGTIITQANKDVSKLENYFREQGLQSKKISKKQILQIPGSIATKAFYVKSGLLRSYMIDDNGKVHIYMFAPENWIISDIESHIMSVPSELFIDALEDSEVIEVNQTPMSNYNFIDTKDMEFHQKLFRRIAVLQRRVMLLMSASAKERYKHFIKTYPQLINRVSLKMVASYLGMTPIALSNIRRKMKNEKF